MKATEPTSDISKISKFKSSDENLSRSFSLKCQKQNYLLEKQRAAKEFLKLLDDPSVIILSDWLKIRGSLKGWIRLFCVLKPGLFILYNSEKIDKYGKWVGTILLSNCSIIERPSKKMGFCFKLFHPLGESIWTSKGPKGENMGAITLPLPSSYLIFRAPNEEAGKCWLDAINMATQFSSLLLRSMKNTSVSSLDKFKTVPPSLPHNRDVPTQLPIEGQHLRHNISDPFPSPRSSPIPEQLKRLLVTSKQTHNTISNILSSTTPSPSSKLSLDEIKRRFSGNENYRNVNQSSVEEEWKTISNASTPSSSQSFLSQSSIISNDDDDHLSRQISLYPSSKRSSPSAKSDTSLPHLGHYGSPSLQPIRGLPPGQQADENDGSFIDKIIPTHLTNIDVTNYSVTKKKVKNCTRYVAENSPDSPILAITPSVTHETPKIVTSSICPPPPLPPSNKIIEENLPDENKSLIWALVKQMKPGMDLSKVTLPTFILEPRSFLDKLSDNYYHSDILAQAQELSDPYTRIKIITKWYLSGFYNKPKGLKKPYNPVLGEIFRCMWKNERTDSHTFYMAEQVSHHPPISSFYVTNRKDGFNISGTILTRSKFYGNSLSAILDGTAKLTLLPRGECYTITMPYAHCKGILVGNMTMELGGKISITCEHTGYSTQLEFKLKPMFGYSDSANLITGKIKFGESTLAKIDGHWDGKIYIKELKNEIRNNPTTAAESTGDPNVFWDASDIVKLHSIRQIRYLVPLIDQSDFESAKLWLSVSKALAKDDQIAATTAKTAIESAQREMILSPTNSDPESRNIGSLRYRARLFINEEEIIGDMMTLASEGDKITQDLIKRNELPGLNDGRTPSPMKSSDEEQAISCSTSEWIYKYTDVRPWDPLNDLYQFERDYVIQTKTLHHMDPLPPNDLMVVDLPSSHIPLNYMSSISTKTEGLPTETYFIRKRQSQSAAAKKLIDQYRRASSVKPIIKKSMLSKNASGEGVGRVNLKGRESNFDSHGAIKNSIDDSPIQYYHHQTRLGGGFNLDEEELANKNEINNPRYISAPAKLSAGYLATKFKFHFPAFVQTISDIFNHLWFRHHEVILLSIVFFIIQIFIVFYLKK